MANKFQVWVEDENINNTQTYSDFNNDSQRKVGFEAGNPASSIRVNTGLRQANLLACALMDTLAPDDNTVDFRSTREQLKTVVENGLKNIEVDKSKESTVTNKFKILTVAPTQDNPDAESIQIVIADNVTQYYNGYLYLNLL